MAEPVRIVRNLHKINDFTDDNQVPYAFIECVQTIFSVNGVNTPLTPGSKIEYEMPDMYGRPWAKVWEEHFEQGMSKPEENRGLVQFRELAGRAAVRPRGSRGMHGDEEQQELGACGGWRSQSRSPRRWRRSRIRRSTSRASGAARRSWWTLRTLPVIGATYQGGPGAPAATATADADGRSSARRRPAKRRRASSRCRATCSRRTTSTRTRSSGPTSVTGAAIRRSRSRTCGLSAARSARTGPATAAWGRCDSDYPREAIVSPYPFKTAQEHWEALKAETTKRGGPTKHTYATVPGDEWTGRYGRASTESWYQARKMQVPTMMSLLTPKYQTYLAQETYHQGNTNVAHWQSQYCWPEGFMRRWHQAAIRDHYITVTPQQVQIMTGIARNFVTNILIGREFDMSGADAAARRRRAALVRRDDRLLGRATR